MNSKLKTAGIIVLCALLITIPLLVTLGKKMKTQPAGTGTTASAVESKGESEAAASTDSASGTAQTGAVRIDGNAMMDLWTDGAPLKNELISYMAEITDESSPKFIQTSLICLRTSFVQFIIRHSFKCTFRGIMAAPPA